jgi:hypothetical protein
MEKIRQYKYIILIILVILGINFYWSQFRPSQIIKNCYRENKTNEAYFRRCLLDHGHMMNVNTNF